MIAILETAAALLWLVLGIATAVKLRGYNRRLDAALRDVEETLARESDERRNNWQ